MTAQAQVPEKAYLACFIREGRMLPMMVPMPKIRVRPTGVWHSSSLARVTATQVWGTCRRHKWPWQKHASTASSSYLYANPGF